MNMDEKRKQPEAPDSCPLATEQDWEDLRKYSFEGLRRKQWWGTLNRIHQSLKGG